MANTKNTTINAASLTTLEARKQPYRDQIVTGLCLQVGTQRRRWFYQYRQGGKLKETTLGFVGTMGLAEARAEARAIKERVEVGAPVTAPPVEHPKDEKTITIGDMIDEYEKAKLKAAEQKPGQKNKRPRGLKSLPKTLLAVRGGLADYKGVPAKQFTKFDMRTAIRKIADRGSLQMADRTLTYASTIFAWAATQDIVDHNPCLAVEKPGPGGDNVRDRVLEDHELRAIWEASFSMRTEGGKNYGALIRFLMIVPLRLNEARLAVYGELLDGRIRLKEDRNKGNREFRLSLPDIALNIIGNGTTSQRIFPKTQSLWRLKSELDDLCGVTGWRTHDLRRTIATRLQETGTPPHLIGALLNHKAGDGAMGHYLHGEGVAQKTEALNAWAVQLEKILKDKKVSPSVVVYPSGYE